MSPSDISNQEYVAIEKFRERLTSMGLVDSGRLSKDYFLVRYLRMSGMNQDKALKMIEFYAKYFKENNFESLYTEKFPQDFNDQFYAYLGGHDNHGRPFIVIPTGGLWNVKKAIEAGREEMFVRYVQKVGIRFEAEVLKRDVEYGYLVAEISNLSYGNYLHRRTLEVILRIVNMLEQISPLVIKKVYFLNAPKVFVAFFNTVRALVKVSADIYAFDSNEKKWKAALREIAPEEGLCPEIGGTSKDFELI